MQAEPNLLEPAVGIMMVTLAFYVSMIGLPIYIAFRFLRAYEGRAKRPPEVSGKTANDTAARIEALEAQVERLSTELEQLQEGQQFTNKLINERGAQNKFAPPPSL